MFVQLRAWKPHATSISALSVSFGADSQNLGLALLEKQQHCSVCFLSGMSVSDSLSSVASPKFELPFLFVPGIGAQGSDSDDVMFLPAPVSAARLHSEVPARSAPMLGPEVDPFIGTEGSDLGEFGPEPLGHVPNQDAAPGRDLHTRPRGRDRRRRKPNSEH